MHRRLFAIASVLSLLLCVYTVYHWYEQGDIIEGFMHHAGGCCHPAIMLPDAAESANHPEKRGMHGVLLSAVGVGEGGAGSEDAEMFCRFV